MASDIIIPIHTEAE